MNLEISMYNSYKVLMTIVCEQPHVLVIPYPAQGHVMPLMKFSYCLADRGFRITFVNTEDIHARLFAAALPEKGEKLDAMHMVSISDGLTPQQRKDPTTLDNAVNNNLPVELERLIKNNESGEHGKIVCVIADETLGWALDVAKKLGIRRAAFFPASAGIKALALSIPKMIKMGVIDKNGEPKKNDAFIWSPTMPSIKAKELVWNSMGGMVSSEKMFHSIVENIETSKSAEWVFCNTSCNLEHAAIELVPNLLPVGPLLANSQLGNFWPEDLTCLSWLDQQAANSVIYIAFGSIAIFNQHQFDELALGLELLGKPFIWVVRSDLYGRPATTYPDGFQDRVAQFGKMVSWAPQQKVLAHPSTACFVSHCGWNSVVESVSMGVPFICWPYFADQFFNETCITDTWKVGLGLSANADGIILRNEIMEKVNELLGNEEIKENAARLKEMVVKSVDKGGSSSKNLDIFMEDLKCSSKS